MRVLLPLKKKTKGNNHQHQHLLEDQDEGEEQLEGQHQQQQQPEEAHPEPRSAPQFAASTSAVGPTSVAATVASSVPAAATAACPSDTETPVFEPSKKRARTNIHSTEPAAAFLLQNSKPAAVARSEVELELELELDPPVVSIHNNTSSSSMAGGRLYPQDEEDDDTDHLGWRQGTAAASASTAARASMTTAGTADTAAATTASTSATTTPLENEPPPVNNNCDGHESNHTHMNYHYNNNRNSHRNPHVARSAASAHTNTHAATDNKSNRSNDPAGDIADDDDANDDANDANDDDQVTDSFRQALKKRGLEIVVQEGDGNCLFRAVSLQVYGDSSMHADVRQQCLDFMARDPEHFGQFVVLAVGQATFSDYIARKRQDSVHGNNPEIQAISELFNRPVEVFTPASTAANCQPLNIFHAEYKTADAPIRLSYHDGNHYNAVIDPLVPTAGLGLGLPGLKPGLADQMQVAKAVTESDQLADEMELARVLKESARDHNDDYLKRALTESSYDSQMANLYKTKVMALSDLDATNFELEQKVLQSSMESYRRHEAGRKQRASPTLGRRRRGRHSPGAERNLPAFGTSTVAAIPPPAAAAAPPVASIASAASADSSLTADEYPQTVQELVMNGFELGKVVHAYELIGDNFDDLLTFLMSNSSS